MVAFPPLLLAVLLTLLLVGSVMWVKDANEEVHQLNTQRLLLESMLQTIGEEIAASSGLHLTGLPEFHDDMNAASVRLETELGELAAAFEETTMVDIRQIQRLARERVDNLTLSHEAESADLMTATVFEGDRIQGELQEAVSNLDRVLEAQLLREEERLELAVGFARIGFPAALLVLVAVTGLIGGRFAKNIGRRLGAVGAQAAALVGGEARPAAETGADAIGELSRSIALTGNLVVEGQKRLNEAEALLRRLIDNSPALILRLQPGTGTVTFANPSAARLLGVSPGDLEAETAPILIELVRAGQRDGVERRLAEVASGAAPEVTLDMGVTIGDAVRSLRMVVAPLADDTGQISEIVCIGLDLTEQVTAEKERQIAEARYQHMFEQLPVGMFLTRADGMIVKVNSALARILGYSLEEMLTSFRAQDLYSDPTTRVRLLEALATDESVEGFETVVKRKNGEPATFLLSIRAVRNTAGELSELEGVVRDITTERSGVAVLEAATAAASRANEAKSEFLSRMSHELRTPLNSILGFGQLLEMSDLDPTQLGWIEHLIKGGRHLLTMIDEILDISRIEAGKMQISLEPVDAFAAVSECLDLVKPMADTRGISLRGPGEGGEWVKADRQRLRQVLMNLLANGIKYNRPSGEVSTSIAADGDTVQISIVDSGIGIPKDLQDRLFEPFERLGAERTGEEGTGLGLALSANLVDLMGGHLEVRSAAGSGSTFTVSLARAQAHASEALPSRPDSSTATSQERTVLYIEDNTANLTLVEEVIALRPGIKLVPASHGRLGIEFAFELRPDLVLLDLHLPDMDGADVVEALQRATDTSSIPIWVLSADASKHQKERLLARGVSAYVTKPIDVFAFLERLDHFFRNEP